MREDKVIEIPRMIGQVTRTRREELGATQQELADAAGVSRGFVNRLEAGAATSLYPEKLFAVLDALGITMRLTADREPNLNPVKHDDEKSALIRSFMLGSSLV